MKTRLTITSLFILIIALSGWFTNRISNQNDRIASLEQQLRAAQQRQQMQPSERPAEPSAQDPAPPHATPRLPHASGEVASCPDNGATEAKLQEATTALNRVQARVVELESQMEEVTRDRTRLSSAEAESQSRITELQRNIEAQTTLRASLDRRIRDVESENARLKQQTESATQKNADFIKLATEFQDVSRRQQVYVTNVLRRYREMTDLLRNLPGMMEMKGNGPELARIQSTLSATDEDVRQLNELNVRIGRVQRQIAAAKP